uniref:TIL domain containing protein n=1 Tax=Rhipicephalus zambeziensis TaxID=60191 RepID=A0A224YG78_9ACAR
MKARPLLVFLATCAVVTDGFPAGGIKTGTQPGGSALPGVLLPGPESQVPGLPPAIPPKIPVSLTVAPGRGLSEGARGTGLFLGGDHSLAGPGGAAVDSRGAVLGGQGAAAMGTGGRGPGEAGPSGLGRRRTGSSAAGMPDAGAFDDSSRLSLGLGLPSGPAASNGASGRGTVARGGAGRSAPAILLTSEQRAQVSHGIGGSLQGASRSSPLEVSQGSNSNGILSSSGSLPGESLEGIRQPGTSLGLLRTPHGTGPSLPFPTGAVSTGSAATPALAMPTSMTATGIPVDGGVPRSQSASVVAPLSTTHGTGKHSRMTGAALATLPGPPSGTLVTLPSLGPGTAGPVVRIAVAQGPSPTPSQGPLSPVQGVIPSLTSRAAHPGSSVPVVSEVAPGGPATTGIPSKDSAVKH